MRLCLLLLICFGISLCDASKSQADEATSACVRLSGMVAQNTGSQLDAAIELAKQVPAGHVARPVSNQAVALLLIGNKQYSQAWQQLTSDPASLKETRPGIRLQHEKLKLWLLLEAKSAAPAEAQFKNLVSLSVSKEIPAADRDDAWYFLGATVCMLESAGKSSPIQPATLQTTKDYIEKSNFKSSATMFTQGYELARAWSSQFEQHVHNGAKDGVGQLESALTSIEQEEQDLLKNISQLEASKKHEIDIRSGIEEERQEIARERMKLMQAMRVETPGRPKEPNPPKKPKRDKNDSDADQRRKDREYERDLDRYRDKRQEYERDLAAWKQKDESRRRQMQQQLDQLDQGVAAKTKAVQAQIEATKQANEVANKAEAELKELRQSKTILQQAIHNANGKKLGYAELIRPSLFPLLDFQREATRLSNAVRKL